MPSRRALGSCQPVFGRAIKACAIKACAIKARAIKACAMKLCAIKAGVVKVSSGSCYQGGYGCLKQVKGASTLDSVHNRAVMGVRG